MSGPTCTREEFLNSYITSTIAPSDSTECSICKQDYDTTTPSSSPVTFSNKESCNHIFCKGCITTWLSSRRVNTCAMCRCPLFTLEDENYDDSDDDEDDSDDETSDDEEGPSVTTVDQTHRLYMACQIERLLDNIWYKIWWLMGPYRIQIVLAKSAALLATFSISTPARALPRQQISDEETEDEGYQSNTNNNDDEGEEEDEAAAEQDNENKAYLPTHTTLVHSFLNCVSTNPLFNPNIADGIFGEMSSSKLSSLDTLLLEMMQEQIAYIDCRSKADRAMQIPLFPRRMREWGREVMWLLDIKI